MDQFDPGAFDKAELQKPPLQLLGVDSMIKPIPFRLDLNNYAARADGRIRRGQLVLMEAMGGGFTWGSALVRW